MFKNDNGSGGGRILLPASSINAGEPIITTIRSLEDADIFVNSRIRSDGTFTCYLGEEIVIGNTIWQNVGVNTELGKGDTPLTKPHISLVPKTVIATSAIHSSIINCNGYANSDMMFGRVIPYIVAYLESILGEHLLTRRVKLTNATSADTSPHTYMASGNEYYTVKANLLCQQQVFGTVNDSYGNAYDTGDDTEQLPGFKTGKVAKADGAWWWLRDVYGYYGGGSDYGFSGVYTDGSLDAGLVNYSSGGVRPLITIG